MAVQNLETEFSKGCRELPMCSDYTMKTQQLGAKIAKGAKAMKYILMMNGTKANFAEYAKWSKKEMEANVAFMHAFNKQLKDEGVYVATEGLGWPDQAKLVRAGKGGAPITDGVFPESKEFLAGYWIVDVESPEQAYKIAAGASAAPGPGGAPSNMPIEVRQVLGSHADLGL
jgi:hypothetical protein